MLVELVALLDDDFKVFAQFRVGLYSLLLYGIVGCNQNR